MSHLARFIALAVVLVATFPAAAASRLSDAGPATDYTLSVDAFLRPAATDLFVRVGGTDGAASLRLEQVQVKIWPRGDGPVDTRNLFDVAAPGGVARIELPRLALLQRVEVRAHVKDGSQNVLHDETTVQYQQLGAVSSDHPLATRVGKDVLADGGNAFDAAAAMLFVLNVVQPSLAGIGGGSEAVVHVASEGRTYALVGRERSPADFPGTIYDGRTRGAVGLNGYSVGVPGTLRTVEVMLGRWGTRSLARALEPAIAYARDGFPVGAFLAKDAALARTALLQPEAVARYRPLTVGTIFRQPDLAQTFELIAEQGASVFYRGEIAAAIVEAQKRIAVAPPNRIADGAGRMTLADLAAYDVDVRPASHLDYKGYDVYGAPAPTNGGQVVLEALGLLEDPRFPLGNADAGYGFGTRSTIHAMVEALRLALADRDVWIGDPAATPVPEAQLLSDAYLHDRALLMSPFPVRMPGTPAAGNPLAYDATLAPSEADEEASGHTTHFSVIDALGNTVSFTTTLRDSFGSGIMVEPYGFVLNNSLSLFNIPSKPTPGANNAGPNKRPMGSQAPTVIMRNGEPVAATGTYGAEFIPSLVLNVVLNVIDHRLPLDGAVHSSRIWLTNPNGTFAWNYSSHASAPSFDQFCSAPAPSTDCRGVMEELRAIGHAVARRTNANDMAFGALASVGVDPATLGLVAAADDVRQTDATAAVVPRG